MPGGPVTIGATAQTYCALTTSDDAPRSLSAAIPACPERGLCATAVGTPDGEVVPITPKPGRNELLVKIGMRRAGPTTRGEYYYWSLFSRVTDNQGEPIKDLQFPMAD